MLAEKKRSVNNDKKKKLVFISVFFVLEIILDTNIKGSLEDELLSK
jgi:hypothetical protein